MMKGSESPGPYFLFHEGENLRRFFIDGGELLGVFTAGDKNFRRFHRRRRNFRAPEEKIFRICVDFINWGPFGGRGPPYT